SLEPITNATYLILPVWSSDGSRMAATDINTGTMFLFDPRISWSQQKPQALPTHPSGRTFIPTSWSPDGTRLAGILTQVDRTGIVSDDLASSAYQLLKGISGSLALPAWPDPRWLNDNDYLSFSWQSKLSLVDQATHVQDLLSVAPDRVSYAALSRDNRR